jgi:hypothetical protein
MLNGYSNKGHVSRTTHGWETRVIHLQLERDYKVLVNMVTIEVLTSTKLSQSYIVREATLTYDFLKKSFRFRVI